MNRFGTKSFEFIEFVVEDTQSLHEFFTSLGFVEIAHHVTHNITQYRQGNIIFIVSDHDAYPFAHEFYKKHGPSACSFAINVENPVYTRDTLVKEGAKEHHTTIPSIEGVGGSRLYLTNGLSYTEFAFVNNMLNTDVGLIDIDHITHNVEQGQLDYWANWYSEKFDFSEIKYFDIHGKHTGLISRAMADVSGNVRIPINEPTDSKSQIQEYLDLYGGPGIQHIALSTDDIYSTVEQLRNNGVKFLSVPDTYYEKLEDRIPGHKEETHELQRLKILLDGKQDEETGLLLQIFTTTVMIGPIFFEIIQRKNNKGFGEGNFQALFESIEAEQIERGYLK